MRFTSEVEFLEEYIKALEERYGVSMTFADVLGVFEKSPAIWNILSKKNRHDNSFCNAVKLNKKCFEGCLCSKLKCSEKCRRTHSFFGGYCHMGIYEYVFPVFHNDILLAFITVGAFCPDMSEARERIEKSEYTDKGRLIELYGNSIKPLSCVEGLIMDFTALACLIAYSLSVCAPDSGSVFENEIINNAINFILLNFSEDISLDMIANYCKCSKNYLCTLFKDVTGKSMWDYVNEIRIDRAVNLMCIRNMSVSNIAAQCGFDSPAYFASVFKRYTRYTPRQYKMNILKEKDE